IAALTVVERCRLVGSLLTQPHLTDYAAFVQAIRTEIAGIPMAETGRRCLALLQDHPLRLAASALEAENVGLIEARDWWHQQADRWEASTVDLHTTISKLESDSRDFATARDWWHDQADRWEHTSQDKELRIAELQTCLADLK